MFYIVHFTYKVLTLWEYICYSYFKENLTIPSRLSVCMFCLYVLYCYQHII